jgi:hypothetical protein
MLHCSFYPVCGGHPVVGMIDFMVMIPLHRAGNQTQRYHIETACLPNDSIL